MKGEFAGAVDFGARAIRVVIGRRGADGTVQIVGHGVAPGRGCVSQGVIQDLGAAQAALKRALKAAENEAGVSVDSLFCGVHGRKVETFIREGNVKLARDVVERSHMEEARDIASRDILAPGKQIITSVTAQEWYVDDLRVMDPLSLRGQILKIRVHFARLPTVIEHNLVTCIESQRRDMEDSVFLPIAASLGCMTPEDMELGAAVLDIGRSTTGLAVYRDHRILCAHCFEWGGYHLTRDVAAGLQVSFEEADDLILEYGLSNARIVSDEEDGDDGECEAGEAEAPSGSEAPVRPDAVTPRIKLKSVVPGAPPIVERGQLDEIIHERARELMIRVRQHLHNQGLMKNLVRGLILTGGGSQIQNCAHLAESVFQVPCRVGVPDTVEIGPAPVRSPEFTAAVGIIRHAFEFRTATRNGQSGANGSIVAAVKSLWSGFRKYYF